MIHTLKKGEQLPDIARHYALQPDTIARENQLSPHSRLCPGQNLFLPDKTEVIFDSIETMAFFSPPTEPKLLEQTLPYLSYACQYACSFDEEGELILPKHMQLSGPLDSGCAPLLCLANLGAEGAFSSALAHSLFICDGLQARLLESIVYTLSRNNLYGLHLAFNYVFPFDRDNYSRFAEKASKRLHDEGFIFSIELAPREGAGLGSALCAGQDSSALAACADRISLMSCRWGHRFSPPLASAPMPQLKAALELMLRDIPAEKLLLGISACGFDWKLPWRQGDEARQLSHADALELAAAVGAEIIYDSRAEAPGFFYTDAALRRHRLWFEDVKSLESKLRLVKEYSLAGISIYSMDKLWQPFFSLLQSRCSIEKLL